MKTALTIATFALCLSAPAFASNAEAITRQVLSQNKVVRAAVKQAKAFTGSKATCETKIETASENGGIVEFEANIICRTPGNSAEDGEAQGLVNVKGRAFGDALLPELDLSIRYAG